MVLSTEKTFDLLLPIIEGISTSFVACSIEDQPDGSYRLATCDTMWFTLNREFNIAGITYKVSDLMPDQWIELKGDTPPPLTFDIYAPFAFNGTVLAQNEVLNEIKNEYSKFPMIWLHEITPERPPLDPLSIIDFESDCSIFFLDTAKFQDWLTPDHDRYVIRPMINLRDKFIKALNDASNVYSEEGMRSEYFHHAKFGEYEEKQGHVQTVFQDQYLSGTQLKIRIPFIKDWRCKNCN